MALAKEGQADTATKRRKSRQGWPKTLSTMVGVAQLVELRIVIPAVVGSSPIAHPIFPMLDVYTSSAPTLIHSNKTIFYATLTLHKIHLRINIKLATQV